MDLVVEGVRFGLLRRMLNNPWHLAIMVALMLAIMVAAMKFMR